MTKQLIIGLATIAVTGAAIVATGMYASTDSSISTSFMRMGNMKMSNPQNMIATLSGKVSSEALVAFQTLMAKHKTEMDAAHSNSGKTLDKTAMQAQRDLFKSEMDALFAQYPELKTAMPTMGKWGMMGRGNGEFEAIIATLPASVQRELKSIHDEYKTKQDTLRTEEKTKIDTILAKYPEVKTKLDTLNTNWPQKMEWRLHRGGQKGMGNMMNR